MKYTMHMRRTWEERFELEIEADSLPEAIKNALDNAYVTKPAMRDLSLLDAETTGEDPDTLEGSPAATYSVHHVGSPAEAKTGLTEAQVVSHIFEHDYAEVVMDKRYAYQYQRAIEARRPHYFYFVDQGFEWEVFVRSAESKFKPFRGLMPFGPFRIMRNMSTFGDTYDEAWQSFLRNVWIYKRWDRKMWIVTLDEQFRGKPSYLPEATYVL